MVGDRGAWRAFLPDGHEGYVRLEAHERNQRAIAEDSARMTPTGRRGAVRGRAAPRAGPLRCRHCGRKLAVAYGGTGGAVLRCSCDS